jgi:hypothetical protein
MGKENKIKIMFYLRYKSHFLVVFKNTQFIIVIYGHPNVQYFKIFL